MGMIGAVNTNQNLSYLFVIKHKKYPVLVTQDIKKKNSVALVRKRTIPTERTPHVGEVSANFCG
jgi:hypothetical protein